MTPSLLFFTTCLISCYFLSGVFSRYNQQHRRMVLKKEPDLKWIGIDEIDQELDPLADYFHAKRDRNEDP